ncbi:MAG: aldo/keto reductase [Spartobacteria bacterium]|nr:aldo/keto reductase [Spartobacteria bacterium]
MKKQLETADAPCFERNGSKMPLIGLGTFQSSGAVCRQAVKTAIDIGYRHVDTARMYENEREVGEGLKDSGVPRDQVFVTSKLQMGKLDPVGVQNSCDSSLRDMDIDYLDLLLIHWPESTVPLADTLGAMTELKRQGKIRQLGVSNFTVEWLTRAVAVCDDPIFCNQIEYHPYIEQESPIKVCREHGIAVVGYSPLARGRAAKDDRLAAIGKKYGKSPAQVALRWLVRQTDVIAIPKGSSEEHIRENIDLFNFDLDEVDIAAIGAFDRNQRLIDPDWAPEWDT